VVLQGLGRFIQHNDASALAPAVVERVRNILTFLQEMEDARELRDIPSWKAHQLTGDRKGTWGLTVTRNWRITFRIDQTEREILDLDYGAPRAKPVVPCLTPMWGDIPVTRLHIPPRPEAVVSCGRDEDYH
jgi:proteic killer suppression protein